MHASPHDAEAIRMDSSQGMHVGPYARAFSSAPAHYVARTRLAGQLFPLALYANWNSRVSKYGLRSCTVHEPGSGILIEALLKGFLAELQPHFHILVDRRAAAYCHTNARRPRAGRYRRARRCAVVPVLDIFSLSFDVRSHHPAKLNLTGFATRSSQSP